MASVASLEKIEIIRGQEFMPSKARLKSLKKMIILGPKTAILGPQFCRIMVLGPHFWWSGGPGPPRIRPCKFRNYSSFNSKFHGFLPVWKLPYNFSGSQVSVVTMTNVFKCSYPSSKYRSFDPGSK